MKLHVFDGNIWQTMFIVLFYVRNGERKVFACDYPNECIDEFENIEFDIFRVFVMGQEVIEIRNKEDLLKMCRG